VPIGNLVKLPPSIEFAINRCLEKDPAKRVGSGKELIELLTVRPPQMPVASNKAPRPKARKSRRSLMNLAFSLMAACVLIAGYFTWERFAVAQGSSQRGSEAPAAVPALKEVPNVVGLTKEEAINVLRIRGFQAGRVGVVTLAEPSGNGKVDSQRPAPGAKARPGSAIHLLLAEPPARGQPYGWIKKSSPLRSKGVTVSYKAMEVDPFDGFPLPISLGILDFTGPGGESTDLSVKFYEALSAANGSFRIFPSSTLKAEQNGLGLASFSSTSKEVLSALGRELSIDFVIAGVTTDSLNSSISVQMIKCASGIRVFSFQFKTSANSRALDDAVRFLLNRQVPIYANQ
jgi:hypothetical protein